MATIIKERADSTSGITVRQDGNIIETSNAADNVIHRMELTELSNQILIHRWIGYRSAEQFKEIIDGHFMDTFKQNNVKKVLVDISNMTGTFASLNDWMAEYLMPKLVRLGFRASAVILPRNIFVKLSAEQWEEKTTGFINGNFEDDVKAIAWLKKH